VSLLHLKFPPDIFEKNQLLFLTFCYRPLCLSKEKPRGVSPSVTPPFRQSASVWKSAAAFSPAFDYFFCHPNSFSPATAKDCAEGAVTCHINSSFQLSFSRSPRPTGLSLWTRLALRHTRKLQTPFVLLFLAVFLFPTPGLNHPDARVTGAVWLSHKLELLRICQVDLV